jgi:hypothetical protein
MDERIEPHNTQTILKGSAHGKDSFGERSANDTVILRPSSETGASVLTRRDGSILVSPILYRFPATLAASPCVAGRSRISRSSRFTTNSKYFAAKSSDQHLATTVALCSAR